MDMQAHTWVDGSIKGVPLWTDLSTGHFFAYREDYFDEAGIPRPSSHGGFDSYGHLWDVAQKLTQTDASGNVTRWGWSSDTAYLGFRILNLVLDLGGHWWDEDKQEFKLTSDEVIDALDTYLIEPIRLGAAYDEDHAPEQSRNEQLPEGVAAMSSSTFSIRTAEDSHPDVAEVMAHAEAPPINPDLPNEQRNYVGWGGFGGLIPAAIPADRHQAAFELAEAQLKSPATTQAIHRHIGPPRGEQGIPQRPVPRRVEQRDPLHSLHGGHVQVADGAAWRLFRLAVGRVGHGKLDWRRSLLWRNPGCHTGSGPSAL